MHKNLLTVRHLSWVTFALGAIILIAAVARLADLAQIPPGLYHDEAVNGLDAWNIVLGQRAPIFFEANGGREPLFIYLQAFSIWLFGPSAWALRIVSAVIGILTIPIFFQLARELTLPKLDASALALIASAGLATSYWHLHWSRVGLRAILLPLLLCLTFYFFLRARRAHSTRDTLLAGLFLGLSMYSYLAARLAPFIYLAFFIIEARAFKRNWRDAALLFATALVTALPLGIYFFQHPAAFASRTGDIALTSSTDISLISALLVNLVRVVGMFFVQGDVEWRHGLALRPVLDPISAALFLSGLTLTLRDWRTATMRLAWLWLIILLLPTILSQQAPDTLRAIGAIPIVYWFVAVGWMRGSAWVASRVGGTRAVWTLLGVGVLLLGSGFFTMRDYFVTWANDPRAYRDFDGEFTEIAQWVNRQTQNVYVPIQIYTYPTVQFLTMARSSALVSIFQADAIQLAPQQGVALLDATRVPKNQYVLLRAGQAIPLNPNTVPELQATETLQGKYRALTRIARVTGAPFGITTAPTVTSLRAEFNGLNLVGYHLDTARLAADASVDLTLYWQRVGFLPREPKIFVQLVDGERNVVARADEFPTAGISVSRYPFGQTIPDRHLLSIEKELAPGRYALQIGSFDPLDGERWDVVVNGTRDDQVTVTTLYTPLPDTTVPSAATKISAQWENGIALNAYQVDTTEFRAGDTSEWILYWQTDQALLRDETIFVQVVNENGTIVAQADHDPLRGAYPTSIWEIGKNFPDAFTLALPSDLRAGRYEVLIGWYDRATNERIRLNSPASSNNAFVLETIQVP